MELFDVKLETIVEKSIDDGSTISDDATERGDEEGIEGSACSGSCSAGNGDTAVSREGQEDGQGLPFSLLDIPALNHISHNFNFF